MSYQKLLENNISTTSSEARATSPLTRAATWVFPRETRERRTARATSASLRDEQMSPFAVEKDRTILAISSILSLFSPTMLCFTNGISVVEDAIDPVSL